MAYRDASDTLRSFFVALDEEKILETMEHDGLWEKLVDWESYLPAAAQVMGFESCLLLGSGGAPLHFGLTGHSQFLPSCILTHTHTLSLSLAGCFVRVS